MDTFITSAIRLFNEKGVKFTLNELASLNKMSKKTIYKQYGDKEKVIELSISAVFKSLRAEQESIMNDKSISDLEKLKKYLCVFPSLRVNYSQLEGIKTHYPKAYATIREQIESDWYDTKGIFEHAIVNGNLKKIDFEIFKITLIGIYNEVVAFEEEEQKIVLRKCIDLILKGYET